LSGVEVLVKWGERTLERAFVDGKNKAAFRLGGEGSDFYAHPRWLGAESLDLVTFKDGEAVVPPFTPSSSRGAESEPFVLERDAAAKWDFGPLTVEARWAVAPPPKVIPLADRLDYLSLNILVATAAVAGLVIGSAVINGAEGDDFDELPAPAIARYTKFLTPPEKKPEPKKVATETEQQPSSSSARAPKPEGASGQPSPHRTLGHSAPGQSNDREKAKELVAKALSGKSMAGIFGGTGLGEKLNAAVGGMEKTTACAGPSCSGLGIKGDGSGGGGLERDLGSLGLRTQGRNTGYGLRPGLAKGTGVMPKCLIDEKTGKCADTEPYIKPGDTIICGEKGAEGLGCLDKELIRKVIRNNLAGVRSCYERALTAVPSLDGKVSVKFTIGLEGNVPSAAVAQSTVGNEQLESCVVGRMKMLQFPRSRGIAVVTYPFIFHTAGK
jgi:hypothetical protein